MEKEKKNTQLYTALSNPITWTHLGLLKSEQTIDACQLFPITVKMLLFDGVFLDRKNCMSIVRLHEYYAGQYLCKKFHRYCPTHERLDSLGIMETGLMANLKSVNTIVL